MLNHKITNPTQQFMGSRTVLGWFSAKPNGKGGFTRIELLAVLMAMTLLTALALPVLAASTANSQIAQCLNNLRQMGRAVQMWGTEHQYDPPWRTFVSDGGTRPNSGSKPGNAWFEYSYLSNELATPRILACPSDSGVLAARDFAEYQSAAFRANATSYFLNLHTLSTQPANAVFGDRNVRFNVGTLCPYANNTVNLQFPMGPNPNIWTNAVHGRQGNLALMDGNVLPTISAQASAIFETSALNGTTCFLKPR